jgi:osmotically inducible lipoprotein OsmB
MSKLVSALGALMVVIGLAGCGGMSRNETIGTAGGAVLGGAVGSAATGGSTIGTVGGAAAGGIIGHELGERQDDRRRR